MQFSCDNSTYSTFEAYSTSKNYNIISGSGCTTSDETKTVYVRFSDNAGNVSLPVNDSIIYDASAPVITINNPGSATEASKTITATGSDANASVLSQSITTGIICNGTLTFSAYSDLTFTSTSDNGKKVCYRAVDVLGNTSYSLSDPISGISSGPILSNIRVNGLSNPVGITSLYPTFSFTFSDPDVGDTQSAYQIVVTESGAAVVWDSTKVGSTSTMIGYVGNNLALNGKVYNFTVRTWDNHDIASSTYTGSFTML